VGVSKSKSNDPGGIMDEKKILRLRGKDLRVGDSISGHYGFEDESRTIIGISRQRVNTGGYLLDFADGSDYFASSGQLWNVERVSEFTVVLLLDHDFEWQCVMVMDGHVSPVEVGAGFYVFHERAADMCAAIALARANAEGAES
jgi:hypothetical protein